MIKNFAKYKKSLIFANKLNTDRDWNQLFHIAAYTIAPNILWCRMCCKEKTTFFLLTQIIW